MTEVNSSEKTFQVLDALDRQEISNQRQLAEHTGVSLGQVNYILKSLLDKGLVKIVGRAEILGRPMLYGTTRRFLEVFGLRSLEDLPKTELLKQPGTKQEAATPGPGDAAAATETTADSKLETDDG